MALSSGEWFPQPLKARTVWHYTSAAGLIGMMTERVLWATECTALNDVSEIVEGFKYIRRWLKPRESTAAGFLQQLAITDPFAWAQGVFVACASLNGDDAGQWRLYGGARAGYAVELDAQVPLQVVSRAVEAPAGEPDAHRASFRTVGRAATATRWYPVAYTKEQRDNLLNHLLAWAESRHREYESDARSSEGDATQFSGERLRDDYQAALGTAAALIKSPGFSGEREARVIVEAAAIGNHVEFRPTDSGVVRYLRLTGGTDSGAVIAHDPTSQVLPVKSITVRRTPYFKSEERTLKSLVGRGGLTPAHVRIRSSNVQLRW